MSFLQSLESAEAGFAKLLRAELSSREQREALLQRSILSVSGLRFILGEDEHSMETLAPQEVLEFTMTCVHEHAALLKENGDHPSVVLGMDSRPSGPMLMNIAFRLYRELGIEVRCLGCAPITQIMAYTHRGEASGFCFFTASHNPSGHNGLKLGLRDGAVLSSAPAKALIEKVKSAFFDDENLKSCWESIGRCESPLAQEVHASYESHAEASRSTYRDFVLQTIAGDQSPESLILQIKEHFGGQGMRFIFDMNGSSRLNSIDVEILSEFGLELKVIGDRVGEFQHAIIPEGESLKPCRELLTSSLAEGTEVLAGMVPDCDGDRGNLVIPSEGKARSLAAQQTFSLCVLAEVASLRQSGYTGPLAVVCNGPTSIRIEGLLKIFDAQLFRAEVGEANVLALAKQCRDEGHRVPLAGEGSNGGNIIYPSTVRDPLMTLISLLKFLSGGGARWALEKLGVQDIPDHPRIEDVVRALPVWHTTDTVEAEALMPVPQIEHEVLKSRYEELLNEHFLAQSEFWSEAGVDAIDWFSYEGSSSIPGPGNRPAPGKGGLAAILKQNGERRGFLWMRGSGTEPVFRVLADWDGDRVIYQKLLDLHRELILKATQA